MHKNFFFRGHLVFTFELLGMNLYEWLKAGQLRGVHLGVTRVFAKQILNCLVLLKKLGIVHCDLVFMHVTFRNQRYVIFYYVKRIFC